jgi:outer membrane protein assembly factor BamD (BamD/ComL family)
MGNKRDKKGKYLLFYGAGLLTILFLISGCAITSNFQKNSEGQEHLEQGEALISKGDYNGAIKEDEEVIKLFPGTSPGDNALFEIGLIWLHPDNPERNYKRSLECFQRLVHDFPQSTLFRETKVWISAINELILNDGKIKDQGETIGNLKQQVDVLRGTKETDAKIEEKNKDLEETIKSLKKQIIASKDTEMNMEEKNKDLEETIKVLKKQINDLKEIDMKIEEKKRKEMSGK